LEWGEAYYTNVLLKEGYDLYAKKDLQFLTLIYKIYNRFFNMVPPLNINQFLRQGFLEAKLDMCIKCAQYILQ
jgi:Centrosomal spindle body, CEP44